jgi:UDP:flavonoid glycosyltransferase YjiC (YdhE family)
MSFSHSFSTRHSVLGANLPTIPSASSGSRRRLLFVGESVSLAHVGRPLALAESLEPDEWDIHFACGDQHRRFLRDPRWTSHTLKPLDAECFLTRLQRGVPLYDLETLAHQVEDDLALFRRVNPDLVIGDFRISLGISSELAGIPFANLCNAHWSPYSCSPIPTPELPVTKILGARIGGMLFRAAVPLAFQLHARPYNLLRRRLGLEPVRSIREMYTRGNWTLFADLPEMSPCRDLPPNHRYLGPIVWSPHQNCAEEYLHEADPRPLVYVTLGSSGTLDVLEPLLEALGRLPVRSILATAGRTQGLKAPSNVEVSDFVPASAILRHARACVFNGGAATGYQALAAGVPVLALPSNADQFFHAEAVSSAGAGLVQRPSEATAGNLYAALRTLLNSRANSIAATRIQTLIAANSAPENFRKFLEEIYARKTRPSQQQSVGTTEARKFNLSGPLVTNISATAVQR